MRQRYIHKDAIDLPRNFEVVAGQGYEEALCRMAKALEKPQVNLALWQPPRVPSGLHGITGDYATAVLNRVKQKNSLDDREFLDTVIETAGRARSRTLRETASLREHFHKMALSNQGHVSIFALLQWKAETAALLDAVNEIFTPDDITLSTRALLDAAQSDFHVDNGTDTQHVRLLHQLYGRGAFYVDDADIESVTHRATKPARISFRHSVETVWEAPPGSLVMVAGKETEQCIVHSSPFVPKGRARRPRCLEVLDFKTVPDMFTKAHSYGPHL